MSKKTGNGILIMMHMRKKTTIKKVLGPMAALLLFFSVVTHAGAGEKDAVLSLSSAVTAPGRQVRLYFEFPGGTTVEPPEMPIMDGLVFKYMGAGGGDSGMPVFSYSIVPLSEGDFTIGPITVRSGRDTYVTNAVMLKAEKGAGVSEMTKEKTGVSAGMPGGIFLEVGLPQRDVFVNERIPVNVRFYADWLDVENLEISDAPSEMYISEKYIPGKTTIEERGGVKYAVLRFSKSFFLPESGKFNFGPVKARCDITESKADTLNPNRNIYDDFLGGKPQRELEIEEGPFTIQAVPLPVKGRPDDFRGAVGEFAMDVKASPVSLKAGEIVTLTMSLKGEGNYATVKSPVIDESEEFVFYEPTASREDEGMVFTQLLKARSSKVAAIPAIRFSFFSPSGGKYVTLTERPIPLKVAPVEGEEPRIPAAAAAAEKKVIPADTTAAEKADIGEGIVYLKESPGKLRPSGPHFYRSGLFLALVLFPMFLVPLSIAARERARFLGEGSPYAARIGAIKVASAGLAEARTLMSHGRSEEFYSRIFRMMQEYLGMRFSIPADGITEGIVDTEIASRIESADITDRVKRVFHDSYLSRYTTLDLDKNDMKKTFADTRDIVTYLNSRKSI